MTRNEKIAFGVLATATVYTFFYARTINKGQEIVLNILEEIVDHQEQQRFDAEFEDLAERFEED